MNQPFVHLHLHTKYSMLDGACHIEPLIKKAAQYNMPAIAITDHGVMHGVIDFYKTCLQHKIKPVIGCEFYINGKEDRSMRDPKVPYYHLVLLAENLTGYHNLAKLNSIAHLEGYYYKPRIDKECLRQHAEGLIGLSACLRGEVNQHLSNGNFETAKNIACEYRSILGENNFFLEMQDHGIAAQKEVNQGIRELARETGIRAVATNDVHYLQRDHAEAHDLMLCIQTSTVLSDPKRMRYDSNEFYFKSREEMQRCFPQDEEALELSVEIAERCNVELHFSHGKASDLHFPAYEFPMEFKTEREYLVFLGKQGLKKLYGLNYENPSNDYERTLVERFDFEVEIINNTGFINYFLVVADFVNWSRQNGVPVGPGRGSGAGSLLAYSLGITQVDPIRFDLIFERFLNPDRISPPDFDIDFCQARRERTIEYVKQKYGSDRVAQIVTFSQLGAKTVIRDIARSLEIPLGAAMEFTKMVPDDPDMTLEKAIKNNQTFANACKTDPNLSRIMQYAAVLEGLYRNTGVHAAGVVIGDKPLTDIIPLGKDKDDQPVTQYAKEEVEECGLLKMDFLGLKTLTVLKEAVDLVAILHNKHIDLATIPLDDEKTFELFRRADTIGVFQLESAGMQRILVDLQPNRIEEIIAILALYRPGPMEMIPSFVQRKKGLEKINYDHPLLEPILEETYGIMVYQEQVQRAAQALAGYTLGAADILRRAMGSKNKAVMAAEEQNFIKGCQKNNNIAPSKARQIFNNIEKFAGYGFNKAHAAAYGIVTYQTAYMKAHFPVEFMCAQISSEIGDFDKLPKFINGAEEMGLKVLPPDVNHSRERFIPFEENILFGLAGIKNVGWCAAEAIVSEVAAHGPFTDLISFCERVDTSLVNKRALEALIKSGAMDSLGNHRAQLFNNIEFAIRRSQERLQEKLTGQSNLFEMLDQGSGLESLDQLPDYPKWQDKERLAYERELLGTYMSGHPLSQHRRIIKMMQSTTIDALQSITANVSVRIAGLLTSIVQRTSKKTKETYANLVLDDGEKYIEAIVFSRAYSRFSQACVTDTPVVILGSANNREGQPKIYVDEVYTLQQAMNRFCERIIITIHLTEDNMTQPLQSLKQLIKNHPGKIPMQLSLVYPDKRRVLVETKSDFSVTLSNDFFNEIDNLFGKNNYKAVFQDVTPQPTRGNWNRS